MRTEFNKLVELMQKYDLYNSTDEVGIALKSLFDKIIEVENRIKCVIDTNKDSRQILKAFAYGIVDKGLDEVPIYSDQFEILQRGCNDIDIAIDMNDTECIDNDWYGLFGTRNGNVSRETLEVIENVSRETFEVVEDKILVNDIIAKLKFIDIDGETMQYIIEQVGMNDQMLRQLIMSNPYTDTTDILEEKRILSNRGELYKISRGCIEI